MPSGQLTGRTDRAAVQALTARLAAAGVPSPEVDARLLLRDLPPEQREQGIARRLAREPLQLILGSVGFRHLDVAVRPGVFIPRPETEILAGEAIARTPEGGVVVEACTGTGAVAVAVATEASPSEVHATDICADAVALARTNAATAGAGVTVHHGDLLAPVPTRLRGRVDVLVANPPYVAETEMSGLATEVAQWDPLGALVAGPTGHEVSDRLIAAAGPWLRPGGWLLLETDTTRARATAGRAAAAGLDSAEVRPDLTGRDRVVLARRPMRDPGSRGLGSTP